MEVEAIIAAHIGILGFVNLFIIYILSFVLFIKVKFNVIFLGQN